MIKASNSLILCTLISLTMLACGRSSESSNLHTDAKATCESEAKSKHANALAEAKKAFDANAAACYDFLDSGNYLSVSLCLKASESSRKQSLVDADQALALDLNACQELR